MYHNVTNASENADKQVQLDRMEGHESLVGMENREAAAHVSVDQRIGLDNDMNNDISCK